MTDFATISEGTTPFSKLPAVCEVLRSRGYSRVVLQFPDEHVAHSVDVYEYMLDALNRDNSSSISREVATAVSETGEGEEESSWVDVFITADSTYGSSVDDVSAEHVSADVLVYFGSDLSSSGAMPVLVVPADVPVDVTDCTTQLHGELATALADASTAAYTDTDADAVFTVLMLYEPGCHAAAEAVYTSLQLGFQGAALVLAQLPAAADLHAWTTGQEKAPFSVEKELLGGLLVPKGVLCAADVVRSRVLYIGDKEDQLTAVRLQCGSNTISAYSPSSRSLTTARGEDSRVFRERYGGVSRVKEAKVVGLVVGSMGLTATSTRELISRLQTLATAAHKKTYTFIMGRLNEAKLCNFPEVDLFVFISNEDVSVIAPKTFHVPVLTPWEFEVGIGARPWSSCYMVSPMAVLDGDVQEAVGRVVEALSDNECSDSESEEEHEEQGGKKAQALGQDRAAGAGALVTIEAQKEGRLLVFSSPAGDFLQAREYQGLVAETEEGLTTRVQKGRTGIAASYSQQEE